MYLIPVYSGQSASTRNLQCYQRFLFSSLWLEISLSHKLPFPNDCFLEQKQSFRYNLRYSFKMKFSFSSNGSSNLSIYYCKFYLTKSNENLVPFSKSRFIRFPNNCFRNFGCKPKPGRTERTFCSVIISPAFISSTT